MAENSLVVEVTFKTEGAKSFEKILTWWKMYQNGPVYLFAIYYSIFLRITLTELNFLGKFLVAQKWAKITENGSICLLLQHFIKIGSLGFFWCFAWCSALTKPNYLEKLSLVWNSNFVCLYKYITTLFVSGLALGFFIRIGVFLLNTDIVEFFEKILACPKTSLKSLLIFSRPRLGLI